MSRLSEETTKGLVVSKIKGFDLYPSEQNVSLNGITWFKEDSYKGTNYDWLDDVFKKASKKQTLADRGTPDFVITKEKSNTIIVIECKKSLEYHSLYSNVEEYITEGFGTATETENYAINGALWYASFLCNEYDVIAVAVSGKSLIESRVTSFVWPKNGDVSEIRLLENDNINNALLPIYQYQEDIEIVLNRFAKTEEKVRRELRRYTLSCANFLRANGIEDNSKAGFVSAIILGLTNHESKLYNDTKNAINQKNSTRIKRLVSDPLGKNSVKMLKASLYGDGNEYEDDYIKGIWDIDSIPKGKRTALKKFYDSLLVKDELTRAPKGDNRDFPYGDTVLSRCIYSLYENVIEVIEQYSGIDIMGEFYTTFLRFTKGNAKEKGIVLTPKHITELFCNLAEYYSDNKFDENTKIIDICCGTGAFLISALSQIKNNIAKQKISEREKARKYAKAQEHSLIGVERDPSMYALAYANMRFHGDGKSNLFNCSSLLIDSYAPIDDSGKTYLNDNKIPLHEALQSFGDIDIAMINPPYSLNKKDTSAIREYPIIQKATECESEIKLLKRKLRETKNEEEKSKIEKRIKKSVLGLEKLKNELEYNKLEEVVISKGQDELDFIASMLHYLKVGGIGIAIVPMSCAGNSGTKLRTEILKHHTLLACMTMPPQLFFDSHVGANTCIMVFKAHISHNHERAVFFGIWKNDGFSVIPHNGRKDSGCWKTVLKNWLEQIDGVAKQDKTVWIKEKINKEGEALPEAYVKTDNSQISEGLFKDTIRKYALYKYMDKKSALDIKDSKKIVWLLDNYSDFEADYSQAYCNNEINLSDRQWKVFSLDKIVNDVHNGKAYNNADLVMADIDDYVYYITRTEQNNGVSMCVQAIDYNGLEQSNAITIGDTTATIFFQDHNFITGPHIIVLRANWINVYTAIFVITLLNQEKFRYPVFGRAFTKDLIKQTELLLPITQEEKPDYKFMEDYIKSLPYSAKIQGDV